MGALALSRHVGESVVIQVPGHGDITVKVVGLLPGSRVRLAFYAEKRIGIWREELVAQVNRKKGFNRAPEA